MGATFVGMPVFPVAARAALADTQLRHNLAHATGTSTNSKTDLTAAASARSACWSTSPST